MTVKTPHLIRFLVSLDRGVRDGDVAAILRAHFARENGKAARQMLIHVLATLGGVIALDRAFPSVLPAPLVWVLPRLWVACLLCAIAAGGVEWEWRRRETRLLIAADRAARAKRVDENEISTRRAVS
jgi:hypothetical protein